MNGNLFDKKDVLKSYHTSDYDILKAIQTLYLNGNDWDLDPCYSKGLIYDGLKAPSKKLDKYPEENSDVVYNNILFGLPYDANTINNIVFDPPFMFGKHGQTENSVMTKSFTMFDQWEDLEEMYKTALSEFYRVLVRGGIVAFKCQDYTDSTTTLTHCYVHNWALEAGLKVEDIFILIFMKGRLWNSNLLQRHARKYHCYWLVLRKP